nr:hypothetical protein BaRGS_006035 [Batillaria attramentaria]
MAIATLVMLLSLVAPKAYDCNSPSRPNERDLVTTGDTVTFTLERRDSTNMLYDIEIFVTPITSGNRPGYENDYGQDFGFFREKLEAEEVVAVVSAAFALIIIVCTVLFFCCYRRYKGLNQKWETHQLSTFQPPPSTVYETKSRMSDTSSGVWASNMSRGASNAPSRRPVPPSSRMARASEDDESVFTDDTPPKQRLLERERQLDQERQRMERERRRGRGRDVRGFAIQNDSFVQADDDHPQDTFVERVIEPRVRPSRLHKPPSYEEAIHESETETEKSDAEEEEEEEEDDDDVDHKQSTEEEEEESEAASSQEEEDDDEDDEDTGRQAAAPKPAPRPKPQPQPQAVPIRPGMQPHPAYPGYPPVQYMGGYPMAPGQFVPIMAGPGANQFRPIAPGPGK